MLSISVDTPQTFGGWFDRHTLYKLVVTSDDQSWVIFKRFKDFDNLVKKFDLFSVGAQTVATSLSFPSKSYRGSFFSNSKSFVANRKSHLQQFLNAVLSRHDLATSAVFLQFIDFSTKGSCGVAKRLLNETIICQEFEHCKLSRSGFGMDSIRFCILTSGGTLFVMEDVYHSPEKALVRWNLMSSEVHIHQTGIHHEIKITCSSDTRKLVLVPDPMQGSALVKAINNLKGGVLTSQNQK